tara:strand:- start:72 stop:293 length:222 start_codon:yes stop_codon:yes gene_type:complete
MARNYANEYATYHSKPKQKKNRASRNAARRSLMKRGRVKRGDGKDIDHKNGNPQDNRSSNLSVMSRSRNRSKK